MDKKNSLQINPVGKGMIGQNFSVQINKACIPALKYLSLFSHTILFYREKPEGVMFQETLKIISVNEKSGICVFEKPRSKATTVEIIDIKPYFPCEDRVMDASYKVYPVQEASVTVVSADMTPCGKIEKYRGDTFLRMDDSGIIETVARCSHIKIFWWFNKFDKPAYRRATECDPPYENAPRTGIFASRSPVRPNPVALTVAKIKAVDLENNTIHTSAIDCFDHTPVIGIAPYNPRTDRIDDFFVPYWLKHWPSFFVEGESDDKELAAAEASPLEKIKKYSLPEDRSRKENIFSNEKTSAGRKQAITVIGARQNNLKNVTVSIPHNQITVVTGVSGSGKSSLVFDTIYAESQYRFFENTNTVQHSGLKQAGRPEFEAIHGLTPAIAVSQTNVNRNPRSTFGTITGLYDMLRSLYAAIGVRHCPQCGQAIVPLSPVFITDTLAGCKNGTLLSVYPYDMPEQNTVITINNDSACYVLLKECVGECLKTGQGAIEVLVDEMEKMTFQTTQMCYACNHPLFELTPATFSFNNPESSCPVCNGVGEILEIDPGLIVTHPELSILDNASPFWGNLRKFRTSPNANWMKGEILALAQDMNVDLELPWNRLSKEFRGKALFGSDGKKVTFTYKNSNGRKGEITRPVEGAVNILKRLSASNSGAERITELYARSQICPACLGERLNKEGRLVTVAEKRIPELVNMPVSQLNQWIETLPDNLHTNETGMVKTVLRELRRLCNNFEQAGLSYITLNRNSSTLSGGELQRTRLVTQLISGITNVSYILDEPFTGLHQKDAEKLFVIVRELKEKGNTVIMVDHNRDVMLKADHIIDILVPGQVSLAERLQQKAHLRILLITLLPVQVYILHVKKQYLSVKNTGPIFQK